MNEDGKLRNLIVEHCVLTDQRRHEDYANLFADNGRLLLQDELVAEGRDTIRAWVAAQAIPPGRHLTTNVRIYQDGHQARGYSTMMYVSPEPAVVAIRDYDVRFVRIDGEWKISEWRVMLAMEPTNAASEQG